MYTVKLADGTVLSGLGMNGNNFVSEAPVDGGVFEDNLDRVIITGPDGITEYEDMKLIQNKQYGDEWWFVLAEKTKDEIEKEKLDRELVDLWDVVLFGGE